MLPSFDPNAGLADFLPPDDWVSPSPLRDRERGALALNDPTGGFMQADWEGEMIGQDYWITRLPDGTPDDVLSITGTATEAKFTFDLEMRPHVTWADASSSWLFWYDPDLSGYALMELPGATSPRLCLDDKRRVAVSPSVLLFYILNGRLCVRSHRDRFQDAVPLGILPAGVSGLGRVGMSVDYRLQIEFLLDSGYTDCTPVEEHLTSIMSGLYPTEVDDQMASTATITGGWKIATQIESFSPLAMLTDAAVIDILVPVDFSQYPEQFIPTAQLIRGLVYTSYTPVDFSQYPESFLPTAQLLSGTIINEPANVDISTTPEDMTSTAWIVDGSLDSI